jgi:hypothetical protein
MAFAVNNKKQNKGLDNIITVVSGLPRSGTSMMMRMLEAGGMPVVSDHIRKADSDNPRGYYEYEKVKQIKKNDLWVDECHGKAFKMVSELLYDLPLRWNYKILFMRRKIKEVLASQKVMLKRLGENDEGLSDDIMAGFFEKHLLKLDKWFGQEKKKDVLYINYNEVIGEPNKAAKKINGFLGNFLDEEKMAGVVESNLYRQRKK